MPDSRGPHINHAYLVGSYLAVNAVPDLALLVDGPSCVFDKAGLVSGQHDLESTLLSCDGRHRIFHTAVDAVTIASTYEPRMAQTLAALAAEPDGALLVSALPMCQVAGTDYARLVSKARGDAKRPLLVLPARSLDDDWLGGYAAVLETLAAGLELQAEAPRPDRVAIVGYLMDRNEGDHRGNLAELRRLLAGLELEVVSIWPSGAPLDDLRAVQRAGTIIGLPGAGQAAEILAERLGARLLEPGLPFGLPATERWLLTLGQALDREAQARAFIDRELARIAPRLQWTLPKLFRQARVVYQGAPYYAAPLAEQLEELGAELVGSFLTGRASALPEETLRELATRGPVLTDPLAETLQAAWQGLDPDRVELLIANTIGLDQLRPRQAFMEWGYPSNFTHHYADEPFLGFAGALAFIGRMANELAMTPLRRELERHHRGS